MTEGVIIQDGVLTRCTLRESSIVIPEGVHTIGAGAFKGCASLEKITLPRGLTTIGPGAFKGCRRLSEINIPDSVKAIGEYAFHRCHSLRSIQLPAAVTRLPDCVFLYCDSLEEISMTGVKSLGKQVFLNDVALQRLTLSTDLEADGIRDVFTGCGGITDFSFHNGSVFHVDNAIEVLSAQNGVPPLVKVIAEDIFRMMEVSGTTVIKFLTNLRHAEIPEGITALGKSCFYDKKGILSVTLPSTLLKIGGRAFRNCINLERLVLGCPDFEIKEDAFKNCTTLREICMPDGRCFLLTGLASAESEVPAIVNKIHKQILGNFFLSGTTLLKYRGSEERVVVPEGITIIGPRAFSGNETIGRVILPDTLELIQQEAFADCLLLQTIHLPDSLKRIEKSAFVNCVKLLRVQLPPMLEIVETGVFKRCKAMAEISFSPVTTHIGEQAFYGCHALVVAALPEQLKLLGTMAFYQCTSLHEAVLPSSIRQLGSNVFTNSGVRTAVVGCEPEACGVDIFSQCTRLKSLVFQEGVRTIGDRFAFRCTALKEVRLPASLLCAGKNVFEGSPWLDTLPEGISGGILFDGSHFSGIAVLPDGITAIAGGAFYGNDHITALHIPQSLRFLGARAFCGCSSLTDVDLPPDVQELPEGVFAYCRRLRCVQSAGQIKGIGEQAFYGCSSLYQVPAVDGPVGREAFFGCTELERLELQSDFIGENALAHTALQKSFTKEKSLAVLCGQALDGRSCTGFVEIPEGTRLIAPYAFCGNQQITGVSFPSSLKGIGTGAFWGCSALERIESKARLDDLGASAFEKCINLTTIHLQALHLGKRVFFCCAALRTVEISGLEALEQEVFFGCKALERCCLPQLNDIGDNCFSGCESLTEIDLTAVRRIGVRSFSGCDQMAAAVLCDRAEIAAYAFEDCCRLREIRLEGSLAVLESYCFSGCTTLTCIWAEGKLYETKGYDILFDTSIPQIVRRIYDSALSCFFIDENRMLLEYRGRGVDVRIPEGIAGIGNQVFQDAVRLRWLTVPETVRDIGARAFSGTPWMEIQRKTAPLVIQNNILLDGSACFGQVIIPAQLKRISGWAFANCFGLTGIVLQSEKTFVEEYAFRNCINLKQVILADGSEYRLENLDSITGVKNKVVHQIFSDCYHCFKTDEGHTLVECTGNIRELSLPGGIQAIGDGVFQGGNLLTQITLTEEVKAIGKSAFQQCKWLTSVKGGTEIVSVGDMAFSGCVSLISASLEGALQEMGKGAFTNCVSLVEFVIAEGVTEIPAQAFYRCHSLKRVVLPSTLKTIGQEAFAFCYELSDIVFPTGLEHIGSRAFAWCKKLGPVLVSAETSREADSFCFTDQ